MGPDETPCREIVSMTWYVATHASIILARFLITLCINPSRDDDSLLGRFL